MTKKLKIKYKTKERKDRLLPKGIPRYIRCYDSGPDGSFDRYTVVFTGRLRHKFNGAIPYVGMSANPFHPQGFGQHGDNMQPIDQPSYKHLGKKIKYLDLPEDCQKLVMQDYLYYWDFTDENGKTI